jgi:hypothetical protein
MRIPHQYPDVPTIADASYLRRGQSHPKEEMADGLTEVVKVESGQLARRRTRESGSLRSFYQSVTERQLNAAFRKKSQ